MAGYAAHAVAQGQLQDRLAYTGAPMKTLEVARVLARGLAWEKQDRFATVATLREALIPALTACGDRLEGKY